MVQPLAVFGSAPMSRKTEISTSMSLTLLDHRGNEVPLVTSADRPIEFIIARDPNIILPAFVRQNATDIRNQLFNLHFVNITQANHSTAMSIHILVRPMNINQTYLFIYKLDGIPHLTRSAVNIDGWSPLCPQSKFHGLVTQQSWSVKSHVDLNSDGEYVHFVDARHTMQRRSIIFGLREMNADAVADQCTNTSATLHPPVIVSSSNFTSDYELQVFTSACHYLDAQNNWKSDGVWVRLRDRRDAEPGGISVFQVGPKTNQHQTQCFSTHLTTFASGFSVLPTSLNWNYVFANAGFVRNKTIYIAVIIVCIIYILLMIYSRFADRKDLEKVHTHT